MTLTLIAAAAAVLCGAAAWSVPRRINAVARDAGRGLEEDLELAATDEARMVAANEALGDLEHRLSPDLRRPVKLAWICFAACAAAAMIAMLGRDFVRAGQCVGVAIVGGAVCVASRRATRRAVDEARQAADHAVAASLGDLYDAEFVLPKRREMRWKRRKRTL